jgi:hypothetical protein
MVPGSVAQVIMVSALGSLLGAGCPDGPDLAAYRAVLAGPAAAARIRIAGLYVTQAIQRADGSVPLVAGRDSRLRVFLTCDQGNRLTPQVRVAVLDGAGQVHRLEDLPAPGAAVPTALDEQDPRGSWDLELPGALIWPGAAVLAWVLPEPVPGAADPGPDRFPAGGRRLDLPVVAVPPLGLTLVPVSQGGRIGAVQQPRAWLESVSQLYPLQEIDLEVGPVFSWNDPEPAGSVAGTGRLALGLEAARLAADPASRRHHVGVFQAPAGAEIAGAAMIGMAGGNLGRALAVTDGCPEAGPDRADLLAHELGHTLGRRHGSCGLVGDDPEDPQALAGLGGAGFDLTTGRPVAGERHWDIMSHCLPHWVSTSTYEAVLAFRAWEASSPAPAPARDQAGAGLLVWGRVREGVIRLEPAFQVTGVSSPPPPGAFTLAFRDAAGGLLGTSSFQPGLWQPGIGYGDFAFVLPLTPELRAAASLTASAPGLAPARLTDGPLAPGREPVAVALRPGIVQLSWDAGSHPLALVKDPSGAVIGIVQGGSAELSTAALELEVQLSAGLGSVHRWLRVSAGSGR